MGLERLRRVASLLNKQWRERRQERRRRKIGSSCPDREQIHDVRSDQDNLSQVIIQDHYLLLQSTAHAGLQLTNLGGQHGLATGLETLHQV